MEFVVRMLDEPGPQSRAEPGDRCAQGLALAMQMGGPAGVEAAEVNNLTLQPGTGLYMRAQPRAALTWA